jgi:hypothetical protein
MAISSMEKIGKIDLILIGKIDLNLTLKADYIHWTETR